MERTRTPWARAPALTQACLAGQEAGSGSRARCLAAPNPALPWGCFRGQIQRRPASLQSHACGLQLPIDWGGGGG